MELNWDDPNLLIGEKIEPLILDPYFLNTRITRENVAAIVNEMSLITAKEYGINTDTVDTETSRVLEEFDRTYQAHSLWLAVKWLDQEDKYLQIIKAHKLEGFEILADFTIAIHKLAQDIYIYSNKHQLGININPLIWTLGIEYLFCIAQFKNSGLLGKPNLVSKKEVEARRRKEIKQLEDLPLIKYSDEQITTFNSEDLNLYSLLLHAACHIVEIDSEFYPKWQDYLRAKKRFFTSLRKSPLKHIYLLSNKYFAQGQGKRGEDRGDRALNLKNRQTPLKQLRKDFSSL